MALYEMKDFNLREPLIIINSSLPQKRESSDVRNFWIPAFAGMTFLEVALNWSMLICQFTMVFEKK
jgi:hypothetical protein